MKIWNLRAQKNQNTEKITYKIVQIKFLEMHMTNQKLSFEICTVGNSLNGTLSLLNYFWHERKIDHFDPYNVQAHLNKFEYGEKVIFFL